MKEIGGHRMATRLLNGWLQLIIAIQLVHAQCPTLRPPCRCVPSIYEPVAILCENAGSLANVLSAIAPAQSTPIDSLMIVDTAVPNLPADAFNGFTILRLGLNRNTLSAIDPMAFRGPLLDSLIELDLSDNQLGAVPQTGITQLRNLRMLYLNRNRITVLPSETFRTYESAGILLKLELAGNRLTDASFGDGTVFQSLRQLQQISLETNLLRMVPSAALKAQRMTLTNLNLGLNQITELPVGALDFPNLSSLSLEFNGLTTINPQSFQGVPNLQFLYMTGNKFPSWRPEMFRFIGQLRTLGIGETPISVIPANAFQYIPNLVRLEMSEAAVDTIERGAFQVAANIQTIVFNKNRLSILRSDMFQGLSRLFSLDLGSNRLEQVEPAALANLPSLSHLDISFNQLQSMPENTLQGSLLPIPNDRRVVYACGNPWFCDSQLEWFRQLLRDNLDIDIDKPGCVAQCAGGPNGCPAPGTPLRANDFCQFNEAPQPIRAAPLSIVGWIILAIIMTILMISICLMALVRYGISHRRKKQKEEEIFEDEQRIMSSAGSVYQPGGTQSMVGRSYAASGVELDLPAAYTLDDRPSYFY